MDDSTNGRSVPLVPSPCVTVRARKAPAFVVSALLVLGAVISFASIASAGAGRPEAHASAAHTRIVVNSSRRDAGIFAMRPNGRGRHRLRRGLIDDVSVSASGRRIAFARSRPTPCSRCPADFFVEVFVANGSGRDARRIARYKHANLDSLAISRDGRWIVLALYRGATSDLYLVRADGKAGKRLTRDRRVDRGASFSPNGRRIVFSAEVGRGSQVFSMRRNGGGRRRLTRGRGSNADPVYSPDGGRIAYTHASPRAASEIYVMRSDGSRSRRITRHGNAILDLAPDFSPNGRSIAFARGVGADFDIYTVRANGRNLRRAAHAGVGLLNPNWTRSP